MTKGHGGKSAITRITQKIKSYPLTECPQMDTNTKTKPKKTEVSEQTKEELMTIALLNQILAELKKLNERAETTGIVTRDKFR